MKTIMIETYPFTELSEEVQERVIKEVRNNWETDIDAVTEILSEKLSEYGYPVEDIRWRLSYCQGDGVAFYGKVELDKLIEKDSKVKELIENMRFIDPEICILSMSINKCHGCGNYDHYNTMEVEIDTDFQYAEVNKEEKMDLIIARLENHIVNEIKSISKKLEKVGYEEIESQTDFETIKDYLIANERHFTKEGKSVIHI